MKMVDLQLNKAFQDTRFSSCLRSNDNYLRQLQSKTLPTSPGEDILQLVDDFYESRGIVVVRHLQASKVRHRFQSIYSNDEHFASLAEYCTVVCTNVCSRYTSHHWKPHSKCSTNVDQYNG